MKIDAVLARHPWPWRIDRDDHVWGIVDANGEMFMAYEMPYCYLEETPDAILELVAAHVAAAGRKSEASKEEQR